MGEVYRARDERLKRDVAIKVLPVSFSADPDRLRRFEQEAEAAGALNYPNITIVYDIGSHDGAPHVVQRTRTPAPTLPFSSPLSVGTTRPSVRHGSASARSTRRLVELHSRVGALSGSTLPGVDREAARSAGAVPSSRSHPSFLAENYLQQGSHDAAVQACRTALELLPGSQLLTGISACVLGLAGERELSRRLVDELDALGHSGYASPGYLAAAHLGLGDRDRAFELWDAMLVDRFSGTDRSVVRQRPRRPAFCGSRPAASSACPSLPAKGEPDSREGTHNLGEGSAPLRDSGAPDIGCARSFGKGASATELARFRT